MNVGSVNQVGAWSVSQVGELGEWVRVRLKTTAAETEADDPAFLHPSSILHSSLILHPSSFPRIHNLTFSHNTTRLLYPQ